MKKQTSLRLEEQRIDELRAMCEMLDVSQSWLLELLIQAAYDTQASGWDGRYFSKVSDDLRSRLMYVRGK